ncbi:MAG: M24 family metallopeptidase [Candidatus Geothermarchaeales archaeon]
MRSDMYAERTEKLFTLLDKKDADILLLTRTENVFYFSGLSGTWGETSMTMLVASPDDQHLLTVPMEEERVKIEAGVSPILIPKEKDRIDFLLSMIRETWKANAVLYDSLDAPTFERIRGGVKKLAYVGQEIDRLRSVKDDGEIDVMKKAAEITCSALRMVPDLLEECETEADLAAELEYRFRKEEADGPAFSTIVACGRRSSLPHGVASQSRIGADSIVLVDSGARYKGYCSDFTRVYSKGRMDERLARMADQALEALLHALSFVEAGVKVNEIYSKAVKVFRKYGVENRFLHGLGHGVGISVHEYPRIYTNEDRLVEGQVITIEPGLYAPGLGGVRVEDTIYVGEGYSEPLAELRHDTW